MNVRVLLANKDRSWMVLDGGTTKTGLQIGVSVKWPEKAFPGSAQLLDSIIARSNGNLYLGGDDEEVVLKGGFPVRIQESISYLKQAMDHGCMVIQ